MSRFPKDITKTLKEFEYFSPRTLDVAVSILADLDGEVKVLAGGTDLLLLMKLRHIVPSKVVNLKDIVSLDYIREEGSLLKIGALTRISTLGESELIRRKYFSIYEATKGFATPQIRNMATIGGNICRSSPAADMAPPLMTLDAEVKLVGPKGVRRVLLEDFFTGPGENILDHEILTEVAIPQKEAPYGTAFEKLVRASADLAKISCAVKIAIHDGRCDDIKIALGAVADTPIRAKKAEQVIKGQKITDEVIVKAAQTVVEEIAPITDVRSTENYRRQVSQMLTRKVIKLAVERAR